MLPAKLKDMMLFNDGESYLGQAKEFTPATLKRKMEAWRGGGMQGEVDIDLGQEKIEVEFTVGGMIAQLIQQYGTSDASGVLLRFAGAYQRDDGGPNHLVEIVVRGRHSELDFGTAKPGDDTEWKVKMTCSYYKIVIDGSTELEIDMLSGLFAVGGVNRGSQLLDLLGLLT